MEVKYSKKMIITILTYYNEFYNRSILVKHPDFVIMKADIDVALHELSKEQREAILNYYSKGINDREFSLKLKMPTRTVSYRRNSAINKLYKILNGRSEE